MIRNVVVGRLRPEATREQAERALAAILALEAPGCVACRVGVDAGLREGSWDFAITNDFVDEAAYRAYDTDPEHQRVRAELFVPISAEIVRTQFLLP